MYYTDKNSRLRNASLATAAFIIKGALMKVYNTPLTVAIKYESKIKGRIVVEYGGLKPEDGDLEKIQNLVDQTITEGHPINIYTMGREEAERVYRENPVQGQFIYEKREPPRSIEKLNVVVIPDWTVCCSASTDFLGATNELKGVRVLRFNHRESKGELEVCYELLMESGNDPSLDAAKERPCVEKRGTFFMENSVVKEKLIMVFIENLKQIGCVLDAEKVDELKKAINPKMDMILAAFKNSAYSEGFSASV